MSIPRFYLQQPHECHPFDHHTSLDTTVSRHPSTTARSGLCASISEKKKACLRPRNTAPEGGVVEMGSWRALLQRRLLLLSALAVAVRVKALSRDDFPAGFIFGAGTSAYQVVTLFFLWPLSKRNMHAFYIRFLLLLEKRLVRI